MHCMKETLEAVRPIAATMPGLNLLVLHGSRARGQAREASDWDFAYLAGPEFDPVTLLPQLVEALRSNRIDLADLGKASALLRYRAAADGIAVFEGAPGTFERFRLDAITAWCEMEPVLRSAYDEQLARLAR
jgi:predicted nucleotidyltransferase